ncbi:unnamed protein product [Leuciscus chuanchicus]
MQESSRAQTHILSPVELQVLRRITFPCSVPRTLPVNVPRTRSERPSVCLRRKKKQKKKKFCTIYPVRLSITVALAAPSWAQRQRYAASHLSKRPRRLRMAVSGEDGLSSGRHCGEADLGCHEQTINARAQLVLNSLSSGPSNVTCSYLIPVWMNPAYPVLPPA